MYWLMVIRRFDKCLHLNLLQEEQLGKMLEGFKSSDVGKGFGAGGSAGGAAQATGGELMLGTSYVDGNKTYKYHYFKTPGSFIFPDKGDLNGDLDVLVVAGGGSGGNRSGGGAGVSGVALGENVAFPGVGQLSVPVIVGDGGPVAMILNLVEPMVVIRDLEMHQILILLLHKVVDMVVVMEILLVVAVVLVVVDT